jgi:microcystin-dependent protein
MSEPYLGQLMCVGFSFNNRGWLNCDGQLLPIAQYQALFSLFGTMYGGDGRTTFGLPGLQGRVPIHTGQGPGLPNYQQGTSGGAPTVVLNTNQIPSHGHNLINGTNNNQAYVRLQANAANAGTQTPTDNVLATSRENTYLAGQAADVELAASSASIGGATALTGGSQSHQNMQPYQTLRWLVAITGLYPSRN